MYDLNKSMKLSIVLGLAGAVILPLLMESYGNISKPLALISIGIWAVFAGLKFSSLQVKQACIGISACLAYSGIMGLVVYVFIHPKIVSFLEKNSQYFYLSLDEQAKFILYSSLIMLGMFVVCFAKIGIAKAFGKLKSNREKTAEYIDRAFEDGD